MEAFPNISEHFFGQVSTDLLILASSRAGARVLCLVKCKVAKNQYQTNQKIPKTAKKELKPQCSSNLGELHPYTFLEDFQKTVLFGSGCVLGIVVVCLVLLALVVFYIEDTSPSHGSWSFSERRFLGWGGTIHVYIYIYTYIIYVFTYIYMCTYIYICSPPPTISKNAHFAHLSIIVIWQRLRKSKNPKNLKIQKTKTFYIYGILHFFLDFWIFGFLDFWVFGFFGFFDFWNFGVLDFFLYV